MSELIDNSAFRKIKLKELILKLHDGIDPDNVKSELKDTLRQIPYGEVVEVALAVKELWQRYKGVFNGVSIKQGSYVDETQPVEGKGGLWRVDTDIKILL